MFCGKWKAFHSITNFSAAGNVSGKCIEQVLHIGFQKSRVSLLSRIVIEKVKKSHIKHDFK